MTLPWSKSTCCLIVASCVLLFAPVITFAQSSTQPQIVIDRTEPVVVRRTFDPKNPPTTMPKLKPNEAAVTQSYFGADARVGGKVISVNRKDDDEYESSMKVESIRMTLVLRLTIWLPENSLPAYVKHEEGHREIAENYYQDAERIARDRASLLLGRTVHGTGPDAESASDNAAHDAAIALARDYLARTDSPCARAQSLFDEITRFGTNAVRVDRAVSQAIEQAGHAPPSTAAANLDPSKPPAAR